MVLAALLVKLLWIGASTAVVVAIVSGLVGASREAMQ